MLQELCTLAGEQTTSTDISRYVYGWLAGDDLLLRGSFLTLIYFGDVRLDPAHVRVYDKG